jgi:hypothetical protein
MQAVFTEAEDAEIHTINADLISSQPVLAVDQTLSFYGTFKSNYFHSRLSSAASSDRRLK